MAQDAVLQANPGALTAHRRSIKPLTGIRFFAAFYVVVYHSRLGQVFHEHGHDALGYFFSNGYLAVPLFFLLSGFILAYTYEGQIEGMADYRRFWEARFARIWPVYFLSLLASSAVSLSFPPPGPMIATLLMVQTWNPFRQDLGGTWNFVCWTLSIEAFFYLCFPWFQRWLERRSTRTQLVMIGLMILLCLLMNSSGHTKNSQAEGLMRFLPLPVLHLPEFFTGVGMGNYFLRRGGADLETRSRILSGAGVWTYLSIVVTLALLCREQGRWTSLIVLAFSALIFGLASESTLLSRFFSTKTMVLGGGISYSIYLMQLPVKLSITSLSEKIHLQSVILRLGLNSVVLILVSLLLFKAVENPARDAIRAIFARIERGRRSSVEETAAS